MHAPQEPLTRPGKASGGRTPSLRTRSTPPERTLTSLRARCLSAMCVQRHAPSHPGWFAIDNALGRLHGGASCSLRVCLRECVASPRRSSSRSAGSAAACKTTGIKGHPEGHVPAWSFAGRRRKQLWPRDRPQPQARVSCGCRRVRAMRDAVRCCARRARARNLAISIVIVQYQRNM